VNWCVAIRSTSDPTLLVSSVRQALKELDPNLPVLSVTTLDGQLNRVLAQPRLLTALASFFAVLAALLSCLGLYGVISCLATRRTREIGIRLALGATPRGILRMVLRQGLGLAGIGILTGVLAALSLVRLISSQLFGVEPSDPLVFVGISLLLILVALSACWLPARRAARVDPMVALRQE
jgi:ABC-type antimicrobial peptide transport system permease subunit